MPLKVKKVTIPTIAASVQFDGTNQYLSVSRILDNSTDFTVEAWVRVNSTPPVNSGYIVSQYVSAGADRTIFSVRADLTVLMQFGATNVGSTTVLALNTWYHLAWVRNGSGANNCSIYINGTRDGQLTYTGTFQNTPTTIGGSNNLASTYFPGYISNVRILKGTALYTSNFTPPNATLSAVANTSLLTCHDTSIYDASTNNFTITNNNTATVSTVSPFTVLRSVSFNGTSQYLTVANSSALQLGTSNFTIEGWFYVTAFPSSTSGQDTTTICDKDGLIGTTWSSYGVRCTNSGGVIKLKGDCYLSAGGGGATGRVTSTTTINTGTWYHFAYVRNGATAYLYINGTQESSAAISNFYDSTNPLYVGYINNGSSLTYWPGYISNFRIVKGTALYTSSFTPAGPLTAITSCSLLTCNDQTIRDASTNNFTITNNNTATVSTVVPFTAVLPSSMKFKKTSTGRIGRSVYFTGASQYLYTPTSTNFDPGTNTPWTLEYWGYPISGFIVTLGTGIAYGNSLCVYWASSQFGWSQGNSAGSNPVYLVTAASYPANNWYHVVVCKDAGNTSRMFINGTQVLSSTYNSSLGSPNRLVVNAAWDNVGFYSGANGYVSNVRWIKGTALYTASFTAPTTPLTAITNTQALTCNAATIVDASTNNFAITNTGASTVSTTNPFGADTVSGTFKVKKSPSVYMTATGGDLITTSGSYKIHTFTTVGTSSFVVSSAGTVPTISVLTVGGGAGGAGFRSGVSWGGGGGGGGVTEVSGLIVGSNTYSVIVGAGGVRGSYAADGGNGEQSSFGITLVTASGGFGGKSPPNGSNGGTSGNGFLGGTASGGGGGGGAAQTGSAAGPGGNGATSSLSGTVTYYGGGGGGGTGGSLGPGGLGGGGSNNGTAGGGTDGTPNTGGGGANTGGDPSGNQFGHAGGSGIVIIKYRYTT